MTTCNIRKLKKGLFGAGILILIITGSTWAQEGYYKDILMDGGIGLTASTDPAGGWVSGTFHGICRPSQ